MRSHDADAIVRPSGETAKDAIGAVWPVSTVAGSAAPGRQIAIRPSSPPVTMRPSGANATAFTALSWKRSTCSAVLRVSDQRMADESKLPEIAVVPSGEIASARTGPPWPRNWACAGRANKIKARANANLVISRLHPERPDPLAGPLVAQRREKGLHGRTVAAALD